MDSLMIGCIVAAIIHFVPQDIVFLLGVIGVWHNQSSTAVPCHKHHDVEAAFDEWKAKKGLENATLTPGRTYTATIE